MRMLRWMCRDMKLDNMSNEIIRGHRKWGSSKESSGNEVEVVWACDEKRGALRGKDGDGN